MTSIEEAYSIANCEHKVGTNQYTFRFNHQWRNKQEQLYIGVRKIHLNFSPRLFSITGLSISNGTNDWNISPWIMITGSMTQANKAFQDDIKKHEEFYSNNPALPKHIYDIYYNPATKKLVFDITTSDPYYFVIDQNISFSSDFQAITGQDSINNTNKVIVNNKLRQIVFDNVWDRENIYVQASFVDLAYGNYLGVTNDTYTPPKIYPIVFGDQKFWIQLYDSLGNEIELPNDGKDNLIIESIMIA